MRIHYSLDYDSVSYELREQIRKMPAIPHELIKIEDNIDDMVSELSRVEIEIRRTHANESSELLKTHAKMVTAINADIELLEQYITFGLLLRR